MNLVPALFVRTDRPVAFAPHLVFEYVSELIAYVEKEGVKEVQILPSSNPEMATEAKEILRAKGIRME